MICCVGDIIKRRLGSFPLYHIKYIRTFSNRARWINRHFGRSLSCALSQTSFFVYVHIYTDVLQTFTYIPAFVTHNQYGSGRLIKLERRVDKRPQCRSNSASPSTLYPVVHTQTHKEKTLYFLFFFFFLFLMQLSEQNEKKNRKTYGWMDVVGSDHEGH
jgi:hypothetical protein